MPVMQFRRSDQYFERAQWQAHVGMNIDSPDAAEGDDGGERREVETHDQRGQVDESYGIDRIERMFAVRSEPVEVLRTVVHFVKAPEEIDFVLQPVTPVNNEVTEDEYFEGLHPNGLFAHHRTERGRYDAGEPLLCITEDP